MYKQGYRKYQFLTEYLAKIFNTGEETPRTAAPKKNIIVDPNLESLSRELKPLWNQLKENSYDFSLIQEDYIKKFGPWKEKYTTFHKIKNDQDLINFLEKYFSTWMKLSFKSKDISKKEIFSILKHEKPALSSSHTQIGKYKNLLIFKNNQFQLNLHLRLKKYKTNTSSLLIIFSFWFKEIHENWHANLELINDSYKNSMIAYIIAKKLIVLNYEEKPLELGNLETGNQFLTPNYPRLGEPIKPSNYMVLEILNENPMNLYEELCLQLYQIENIIKDYNEKNDFSPYSHFEGLTSELQKFLIKGKELFLQAEDLLHQSTTNIEGKKSGEIKGSEESKLKFEQIIAFFKDALERDRREKTKLPEDQGYRTKNQLYDDYKEEIHISKPTFYTYFDNLSLKSYLKVRKKFKTGGGNEFRYKDITSEKDLDLEEIEIVESSHDLLTERLELQKALSYYNNNDYQKTIEILELILTSKKLHSDLNLYCTYLYYLGRSYFKKGKYEEALTNLNKGYMKNKLLYNVKYALINSYLYLHKYEDALNLADEIILGFRNILRSNDMSLNLDDLFINVIDLDAFRRIHPKIADDDMFSKFVLLINKPQLRRGPFVPRDLPQDTYDIINNNIISLKILYKKYLASVYLKLEILRRLFFRAVLEKKEDKIVEVVDVFLQYSKDLFKDPILYKTVSFEDYENYVSYFRGLSKLFKLHKIEEKISLEFPNVGKSDSYPRNYYLQKDEFSQYYTCLNYLNEIFYSDPERRERIFSLFGLEIRFPKKGKISETILQAEYYFIGAYANLNYLMDNRIRNEEEINKNLDVSTINSLERVFMKVDDFHSRWHGNKHPILYIEAAQKAFDYCKEHEFDYLINWTTNILKETLEKYEIIEKLRLKRRIQIINRKLEILSKDYKEVSENITLSFQMEPKEGFKHFVQIRLKRELESILRERMGNVTFTIQLFNPELNRDVMKAIMNETFHRDTVKDRPRSYFMVKMIAEENELKDSFILKLTHMRDFERESGGFSEDLDKITWVIYNAIGLNLASFEIKIDPANLTQYQQYFKKDFKTEYENQYFEFYVSENLNEDQFIIHIKRLVFS
ncbi:hypothetical protein LCGC14_1285150 [marine sediment metagenome]|uniref:Tetratricopeptide repeat protein n=1 Tax=marine sediment metagenome TaxID=412755 RepID=A0A0F9NAS4_9ZZZZ